MKTIDLIREERFYHGTSEPRFQRFSTPEVYLTKDRLESLGFAHGIHRLGQTGSGDPHAMVVDARPGKTLAADDVVQEIIMDEHPEFRDLDDLMAAARGQGYRYVTFEHPSTYHEDYFTVTVSLHPSQDLKVLGHQ